MNLNVQTVSETKLGSSQITDGDTCVRKDTSDSDEMADSNTVDMVHLIATAKTNGVYVDMISKGIREIPTLFYDTFRSVKYLYLEGNSLQELSESFFPSLVNLKWLDIRNNKLHSIPKSVGGHQTLETLLLQGNKIKELPLELGLVPKLRGLQLQGNPINYPSREVMSKGVKYLLQFLRDELESKSLSNVQPVSELYYQNSKPCDTSSEKKRSRQAASKSCTSFNSKQRTSLRFPSQILELKDSQMSCVGNKTTLYSNDRARPQSLKISLNQPSEADDFESNHEIQLPDGDGLSVEEKFFQHQQNSRLTPYEAKQNDRDAKIKENFMKEMWICKLKDMLEQQGRILQRRKDEDILKDWRQEYRKRQSIPRNHKFEIKVPYDTNPHLIFDGTEKPQPQKAAERMRDIGVEMAEIFHSLQNMSSSKIAEHLPPQSKQMALDMELKKLSQLQQKLAIIKKRNNCEYQTLKAPEKSIHSQARKSAPNLHTHPFPTGKM